MLTPYPLRADLPHDDGIAIVSPPQHFEGGEAEYDAHIGGTDRPEALRPGLGAWQLVHRHALRPIETVVEIGAGSGTCSLGLVAGAGETTSMLLTDTSPTFLKMVRTRLQRRGSWNPRIKLATLAGEDLQQLEPGSADALVIASALHHVGDGQQFFRDARTLLRPQGVMAVQEPCREGNLMMGMALDMLLASWWTPQAQVDSADRDKLQRCRDSIYLLANSTITKVGEDKHSFLIADLMRAAEEAGFSNSFCYSNFHFQDLLDTNPSSRRGRCSFTGYFDSFLEHHHRVSPAGLEKIRSHLYPALAGIDATFANGDGAPLLCCMVFR